MSVSKIKEKLVLLNPKRGLPKYRFYKTTPRVQTYEDHQFLRKIGKCEKAGHGVDLYQSMMNAKKYLLVHTYKSKNIDFYEISDAIRAKIEYFDPYHIDQDLIRALRFFGVEIDEDLTKR